MTCSGFMSLDSIRTLVCISIFSIYNFSNKYGLEYIYCSKFIIVGGKHYLVNILHKCDLKFTGAAIIYFMALLMSLLVFIVGQSTLILLAIAVL